MTMVLLGIIGWLAASTAVLAVAYRRAFFAAWREPVLRAPVLILESDDWGYGPPVQAECLDRIADVLAGFRDTAGRHPVVTLGVVLAGPDTDRMQEEGASAYRRLTLDDSRLAPVREAMLRGANRRIFALQLHGMEHFWPTSVMRSSERDARVRQWLVGPSLGWSEDLPAPLQSRWIDASVLPSAPLGEEEAAAAASEEARAFAAIFGVTPDVVVPATFVWTDVVEMAWISSGLRVVVTPGLRNESRDGQGRVVAADRSYVNAQTGPHGVMYVVRDAYFEPSLGQTHDRAIAALRAKARTARPALFEMHRFNFIGGPGASQAALEEVKNLLRTALVAFPSVRFMSTAELAQQYRERSALVDTRAAARMHFLIRRLSEVSRLRKLAWATGAVLLAWVAYLSTRSAVQLPGASAA
jgi:hypothetical protein